MMPVTSPTTPAHADRGITGSDHARGTRALTLDARHVGEDQWRGGAVEAVDGDVGSGVCVDAHPGTVRADGDPVGTVRRVVEEDTDAFSEPGVVDAHTGAGALVGHLDAVVAVERPHGRSSDVRPHRRATGLCVGEHARACGALRPYPDADIARAPPRHAELAALPEDASAGAGVDDHQPVESSGRSEARLIRARVVGRSVLHRAGSCGSGVGRRDEPDDRARRRGGAYSDQPATIVIRFRLVLRHVALTLRPWHTLWPRIDPVSWVRDYSRMHASSIIRHPPASYWYTAAFPTRSSPSTTRRVLCVLMASTMLSADSMWYSRTRSGDRRVSRSALLPRPSGHGPPRQ